MHAKDPNKTKYQFLINKRKVLGLEEFNSYEVLIEYSNTDGDILIEEYNPDNELKMLIICLQMFSIIKI